MYDVKGWTPLSDKIGGIHTLVTDIRGDQSLGNWVKVPWVINI